MWCDVVYIYIYNLSDLPLFWYYLQSNQIIKGYQSCPGTIISDSSSPPRPISLSKSSSLSSVCRHLWSFWAEVGQEIPISVATNLLSNLCISHNPPQWLRSNRLQLKFQSTSTEVLQDQPLQWLPLRPASRNSSFGPLKLVCVQEAWDSLHCKLRWVVHTEIETNSHNHMFVSLWFLVAERLSILVTIFDISLIISKIISDKKSGVTNLPLRLVTTSASTRSGC